MSWKINLKELQIVQPSKGRGTVGRVMFFALEQQSYTTSLIAVHDQCDNIRQR